MSLTLGTTVATLVAKQAVDKAAGLVVDDGSAVLGRLATWLRDRLSSRGRAESDALARVEDAPDSPSRIAQLAEAIDGLADEDDGFRTGLEDWIAQVRSAGVDVGSIVQTIQGNQNVAIAGVVNTRIHTAYGHPLPPTGR